MSKRIGILDRKKKEKIIVKRVHDYLFCEKDQSLECVHCLYRINDKDVKNHYIKNMFTTLQKHSNQK